MASVAWTGGVAASRLRPVVHPQTNLGRCALPRRPPTASLRHFILDGGLNRRSFPCRLSSRRCVVTASHQFDVAPALGELYNKVKTQLAQTYVTVLPGPYQYLAALTVPTAALLSVFGGTFGHEAVLALCGYLPMPQTVEMVPMARTVLHQYHINPHLFHVLIDTTLSLAAVAYAFLGLPALDLLLGDDPRNLTREELEAATREPAYRWVLYACVGAHWLSLLTGCVLVGTHDIHPLVLAGMAVSMGIEGGLMFTMAHELVHSRSPAEKAAAGALLGTAAYMHWHNSHLAHHCKVATVEDPASARLGESLYNFIPRSVIGNLQDGFSAELARMQTLHVPFWSLHNRMLVWVGTPLGLMAGVYSLWGPKALLFGITQGLIAVILLETVNYVEHYGLQRRRLPNGGYERVACRHSWNANCLFTNSVLFQLQRHSDHHAHGSKHYQVLESVSEAPQLPAGYPVMMMLALFPGLWFDIMDPRVQASSPPPSSPPR